MKKSRVARQALRWASLIGLILLLVSPAAAQDAIPYNGSADLAAALAFVPDNSGSRSWTTYGDYRAAAASRGMELPEDYASFAAEGAPLVTFMPAGGLSLSFINSFGDMPAALGFDFFTVERTLTWGLPPDQGIYLSGAFDVEAVRAAHLARGFVEHDWEGTPVWCSAGGCDAGALVDFANRQPADIFGGDLGRRFPRAATASVVVGAGVDTTLADSLRAGLHGAGSYADNPLVVAALRGLDGEHYLRAAQFARPDDFLALALDGIAAGASEEAIRAYQDAVRGGVDNLPVYNLAVFGDAADAKSEYALIVLVYRDEALAQAAASVLDERLQVAVSGVIDAPWRDLIAERGGEITPARVIAVPEVERAVVLIALTAPLPGSQPGSDGRPVMSGALYSLILNAFSRRDLGWLQPVLLN
ncbi:MAG: hypothetical protein JNL42_10900 [Anaerolineae bacterium]|nr:hypothetical protein [Anaerolineae bacterium]